MTEKLWFQRMEEALLAKEMLNTKYPRMKVMRRNNELVLSSWDMRKRSFHFLKGKVKGMSYA